MTIAESLLAKLPNYATRIIDYTLVDETETTQTYSVLYKEVICGISGRDTEEVTINKIPDNPATPV